MSRREVISAVDSIIRDGKSRGIIHLNANEVKGSRLSVRGRSLINFGSCSYLGLEFDERLIRGSQLAVEKFGTQFSASRAYISCGLYEELEDIFRRIFKGHVMIAPTTTLGHISTIPVIVNEGDAVIVDHQVHASVQGAVELLKTKGVHVELVRHNRMDMLEERISALTGSYDKIWYMADGIYSMFGDKAPVLEIQRLLNTYENFHFYVDDAHGMSCYGERGQGFVLSEIELHPRMVLAISLAKAFATGGSVFVFHNEEMAQLVRNCGGPMITSGPMQPGALGAAVASGKIHLSEEYSGLQKDLQRKIAFTNRRLKEEGLPLIAENDSPVFFVGCGLPKVGMNLVERMNRKGYMTNLGVFPAVPMKNTGLRFTITRLNAIDEIDQMINTLAGQHYLALNNEGYTLNKVYAAFRMKPSVRRTEVEEFIDNFKSSADLEISHVNSIHDINTKEWDALHANEGAYDSRNLAMFENTFHRNASIGNHWEWDYITIKDAQGKVILSTFLTTALYKDDMLASDQVSNYIESLRKEKGADYMTSRTLSMGSPITTGKHLYIDRDHPLSTRAIEACLKKIQDIQESREVDNVFLRDFIDTDCDMDKLIKEQGFMKMAVPNSNELDLSSMSSLDDYINARSYKSRRHIRSRILKNSDRYSIQCYSEVKDSRAREYFDLYMGLKGGKREINTFDLCFELFERISHNSEWDKIEVIDRMSEQLAAVIFNYKSQEVYNLMFIGVDSSFTQSGVYRQALLASVERALELGCKKVFMGFTADVEKHNLGCIQIPTHAYLQAKEHYSMEYMESLMLKPNRV